MLLSGYVIVRSVIQWQVARMQQAACLDIGTYAFLPLHVCLCRCMSSLRILHWLQSRGMSRDSQGLLCMRLHMSQPLQPGRRHLHMRPLPCLGRRRQEGLPRRALVSAPGCCRPQAARAAAALRLCAALRSRSGGRQPLRLGTSGCCGRRDGRAAVPPAAAASAAVIRMPCQVSPHALDGAEQHEGRKGGAAVRAAAKQQKRVLYKTHF